MYFMTPVQGKDESIVVGDCSFDLISCAVDEWTSEVGMGVATGLFYPSAVHWELKKHCKRGENNARKMVETFKF